MKKFKFLKISKTKKLRYISNYYKKNLYIIFLPGFASDIEFDQFKINNEIFTSNNVVDL